MRAEKEMSSTAIKAASFFYSLCPILIFLHWSPPALDNPFWIQVRAPLAVTEKLSGFAQDLAFSAGCC